MKVVVAHNFYSAAQPSGENQTVTEIVRGLRDAGVDVTLHRESSDAIADLTRVQKVDVALRPVRSFRSTGLAQTVARIRPHIVQVHNVYPFISPADFRSFQRMGARVVHVVHNFRHSCVRGSHFRAGASCHTCNAGAMKSLAAVGRGCYRDSRLQSGVLALSNAMHHGSWRALDAYSCISEFMKDYMIAAGFDAERMFVNPNPVGAAADRATATTGRDLLFAGRLEEEKGLGMLLSAWATIPLSLKAGTRLHLVGSGTLEAEAAQASRIHPDVLYHGKRTPDELRAIGLSCRASVVPSVWDEPFGRVVIEAFQQGRGAVVTRRGGLPELVSDGVTGWVAGSTVPDLAKALAAALTSDPRPVGQAAIDTWRASFTRERVTSGYIAMYEKVLAR